MTFAITPMAHASVSGVEISDRTGDFTQFVREFEPDWVGSASIIRDRGNKTKVKSAREATRNRIEGLPGTTIPDSGGFGGSANLSILAASFGAADGVFFDNIILNDSGPSTTVDELLNPFTYSLSSAPILDDIRSKPTPWIYGSEQFESRIQSYARAKFNGERSINEFDSGWVRDAQTSFTEVLLNERRRGKKRVSILANGSNHAEGSEVWGSDYLEGRVSAYALADKDARSRATATSQTRQTDTFDVRRTQMVYINGYVNLTGDADVDVELVHIESGESVFSWDASHLGNGQHDVRLVTALDGVAFDPDNPDVANDYEVRITASATASAKSKFGRKTRSDTSAVEYSLPLYNDDPVNYRTAEWTYRAPRWTDALGNAHIADATRGSNHNPAPVPDGYTIGGAHGALFNPGTITSRLPFAPETVGTDAYSGAYALSDDMLAIVSDDLAAARLTPRENGQGFWLTFGDAITADVADDGTRSGDVLDHAEDLLNVIAALTGDRLTAEAALSYSDAAFRLSDTGLLSEPVPDLSSFLVSLFTNNTSSSNRSTPYTDDDYGIVIDEALASFWQPLAVSYTPGFWEKTADEFIPTAEEAMAAYLASLEADGVAFDPILGPAGSSSPLALSSPTAAIPEPGTLAALSAVGLIALRRRREA
ncbi:MAG: PEP-CTERM sorting domain-containing protein [Planctomycetota bacterium]